VVSDEERVERRVDQESSDVSSDVPIDLSIGLSADWPRHPSRRGWKEAVMPLFAPQLESDRQVLSVKTDVRLPTLLKNDTDFIASAQDYVASQALP
jgi:hypothetical protein